MIRGQFGRALQRGHDMRWCRQIGIADTEADHVDAGLLNFALKPIEFGKKIGW